MNIITRSQKRQAYGAVAGRRLFQIRLGLTCILLTYAFEFSYAQKAEVLLTRDSCQMPPTAQTGFAPRMVAGTAMVRVAYVIPSNRTPQADGVANLQHAITTAQQFFKDQMEQNGFGPKTFTFETEGDGITPKIHVVSVPETDDYLRGDVWGRTSQAAANAGITLWSTGEVWVLVPEAHLMQPDGSVVGGVALGASFGTGNSPGVSMIGSNALPLFGPDVITDDTPYDGKILPALGPYPMKQDLTFAWFEGNTFSSLASSWLGALYHETGHAFGLAHDFRNDNNFHGNLMGNGLRGTRGSLFPDKYPQDYTRLEYASSLMLNASHFFSNDRTVTPAPTVFIKSQGTLTPQAGLVHLEFQASDPDSLQHAHLRYNGDMVGELILHGTTVDTLFAVPYYTTGGTNQYTIAVHDKQGNVSYNNFQVGVSGTTNRAPIPFIVIVPPAPASDQTITLDATQSSDPDGMMSSVLASWDLNNDGTYDTPSSTNKVLQHQYASPGRYLIRVKLTDAGGAETVSTAVSITIPGEMEIAVESFTLINATDDEAVTDLKDGAVLKEEAWIGRTFNVRANTSRGSIDQVVFDLKGPIVHAQVERQSPYALFGDDAKGDFAGKELLPGEYTLTARPYANSKAGIALTISFKVIQEPVAISFTLMNAHTDQEVKPLSNGDTIRLTDPGMKFPDIRANAAGDNISSVVLDLNGPVKHHQAELQIPYALFGDLSGNFNGRRLLPGTYTLRATSYDQQTELASTQISFTVINGFDVVGFTLIDATLDKPARTLTDGDAIDLSLFNHHKLAIRADIEPTRVEKVDILLEGPVRYYATEHVYPYALFGDIPVSETHSDYTGGRLKPGTYTLSATPYFCGLKGITTSISFEVTDGQYTCGRIQVYPIPATDVLNVAHEGVSGGMHITLLDANGSVLISRPLTQPAVDQINVSGYRGTHYLKISSSEGSQTIRFVVKP